ncbi:MAG TPA: polymer-forming cytoskeletal protein [Burkholderiaceae bacterium]|jgi:cytoskeletal protein CcmA (bactofilin family)|nr:polymer-forming cytoskeletal protein [Burkholderiaceae bacterium]
MWSVSKKQPPIRSLIGEGTVVQGEVRYEEGLRIDGEVQGDVVAVGEARNLLVISEKARVVGKVKGGHVIINGTVIGPVECDELLELQPKARIEGDVRYGTIEMHQGAAIDGELRTIRPSEERPALKLAASSRL